jgi:hypothetical protein
MAITLVASVTSIIAFLTVAGIERLVRGRRSRANLEAIGNETWPGQAR